MEKKRTMVICYGVDIKKKNSFLGNDKLLEYSLLDQLVQELDKELKKISTEPLEEIFRITTTGLLRQPFVMY
ncbi:hypothetical protein SAMN05444673_2890 [Bacillus sp. OV166]|uniref:hypothetical protein n=1 Tax=Bacillus sp. OV166 TaxID=1882763 RepID=UPI000A2AEA6C|nr:hypothetical protein [Bacillus sp. OV166]SMQ77556.1 hypothetical protein SAMN05444673_2890 [Bacillus sp. OV166]